VFNRANMANKSIARHNIKQNYARKRTVARERLEDGLPTSPVKLEKRPGLSKENPEWYGPFLDKQKAPVVLNGVPPEHNPLLNREPLNELMMFPELNDFDVNDVYLEAQKASDSMLKPYDNANIGTNRTPRTEVEAFEVFKQSKVPKTEDWNNYYDPSFDTYSPHDLARILIRDMTEKPDNKAVMRKTWPLLMAKQMLKNAVDNGSDRLGILDSVGIGKVLLDEKDRPFRTNWHDNILPDLLEKFLKSQGIDAKFGAKEGFKGGEYMARFIELTPQIRALVKKGMPLYAALAAVGLGGMQLSPEQEAQLR
jgi:hypothetical protein